MNSKWNKCTEVFDEYERRFAMARASKQATHPWESEDKEKIVESVKRMIRYDESLVPTIREMKEMARTEYGTYSAIQYRFESWKNMYGCATLYLPHSDLPLPLVFVCCGHGDKGRLTSSYMAMGHRLASCGLGALVIDNIGQGDRSRGKDGENTREHWKAIAPFAAGLTLQGLIVMETVALIRYMQRDERFDRERFSACGNSGGGTLTMFLSALAPELSVIASSGYPSEIPYVLQKEREHCACNLFVGQANEAEMWEIYSTFAPKPLFLEGGSYDDLIPMDLAHRNARKVKNTYVQLDAVDKFSFKLTRTRHSWEIDDINLISRFLSENLINVTPEDASELFYPEDVSEFRVKIPDSSMTTKELSEYLTGISVPDDIRLEDVFKPTFDGEVLSSDTVEPDVGRGNVMRVFAQFECALFNDKKEAR